MIKTEKCCICGKEFPVNSRYWGNNPEPVKPNYVNGKLQWCCDKCNAEVVIPARMGGR